jgi:hypothetical protein
MDKEKEGLSTSAQEAITNAAKANVHAVAPGNKNLANLALLWGRGDHRGVDATKVRCERFDLCNLIS